MTVATFSVWTEPAKWFDLPLSTWQVVGPPRREKSTPPKAGTEDDYKVLGRPAFGLCPLEDACRWIFDEAKARQERVRRMDEERREHERLALDVARLYARLEARLGLYALEAVADLRGLTREQVTDLLSEAAAVMERAA